MILSGLEGVPFVPVWIQGTHRALPRGRFFPYPAKVTLTVGKPEMLPPRAEGEPSREYFHRCAALVEQRLRELGAQ